MNKGATTMDQLVADQIRRIVADATGQQPPNVEPWPGCPIGHIPIDPLFTTTLDAMVDAGELVIVERPKVTNPRRVARFVAFAEPATRNSLTLDEADARARQIWPDVHEVTRQHDQIGEHWQVRLGGPDGLVHVLDMQGRVACHAECSDLDA